MVRDPAAALAPVPGTELLAACTPTGPELCFNANDDNCNAVIDEGCGLTTGPVQFVVAWSEVPTDVDLTVTTPGGERVEGGHRTSATGMHLGANCPSEGCGGQNVENAWFDGPEPERGRYLVEIALRRLAGGLAPVRVRFGAKLRSRTFGADVVLEQEGEKKGFTFDL